MQTLEVSREDWEVALADFTARHVGWLISLDVLDPEVGAQAEINNLPLIGVYANPSGSITISAARSPSDHISHTVEAPTRVYVERRDDGADVAMDIETADRTKTILRFRVTALPETLDGIAQA